jgi:hypothetical protein
MKLNLLSAFLVFSSFVSAQNIDSLTFEMNAARAEIDTANHANIWQIGKPSKVIFNSAYSPTKAIVTDTLNPYPVNSHSSFKVGFDLYGFHPVIGFRYKLDTDGGKDGGFVEASFDNGQNWMLLTATTDSFLVQAPFIVSTTGFYTKTDTLDGGQAAFSGLSPVWKYATVDFACFAVKMPYNFWLRFTFVSDSVQNNMEGWMIDNIIIDNTGFCSGIAEIKKTGISLSIEPNPFAGNSLVHISTMADDAIFTAYDVMGRQALQLKNIQGNYFVLERKNLKAGLYYYTFENKGAVSSGKFVVVD